MNLTLDEEDRDWLVALLEERAKELHPEIRRCAAHVYKDDLKKTLVRCEAILDRLKTNPDSAG
ncbi:MAG: hypothetical protein KDA44_02845 [Planctomycetales bacterium]|nr:hypothetical protein [Planctomycetales bacterium]